MTYPDWREPFRRLSVATGPATEELLRVAAALGCCHNHEPHGVLSAIIEDWLMPVLHGEDSPLVTDKQLAFLARLGHADAGPDMHRSVASAWIDYYLSIRTAQALESLQLSAGDHVSLQDDYVEPGTGEAMGMGGTLTVSSISANGLV